MQSTFVVSRTQIILGLCIPLAVLIGFFLAEPLRIGNLAILASIAFVLTFPLVIRWHHPLLVLSWNAAITPSFLPGRPDLWMLLAGISFLVAVLNRAISQRHSFKHVPAVSRPLVVLLGVVLLTASATGGIGVRALGAETYGGKGYFYIIAAVLGYFALCNGSIAVEKRQTYVAMFLLSGLTYLLSNLVYAAGKPLWWLFYILPGEYAKEQVMEAFALNLPFARLTSLYPASLALYSWLLARYGLRGVFVWHQPWRLGLFCLAWLGCIYSGFRSALVLFLLLSVFQFLLEKLHRTRVLPIIVGGVVVTGAVLVGFADKLPMVMQRTISILPVKVDHVARASADASNEWRLEMWRSVLPEVPHYLLKGKGYALDPNQYLMTIESSVRGFGGSYQGAAAAGDYHNGPLSVIIPFGIWGALAFLWFLGASLHYLYRNYRYGEVRLKLVNTLLLSLFAAKAVFFLFVFGAFSSNLAAFAGIVGFAAALNSSANRTTRAPEARRDDIGVQKLQSAS